MSGVHEYAQHHSAESLGLAVLKQFFVLEGSLGLLRLVTGQDALVLEDEVGMLDGDAAQFREDGLSFFEFAVADEPARTARS